MKTPVIFTIDEFLSTKADENPFLVVLGRPISHSLSPLVQNFALDRINSDSVYYPILVPEGHENKLSDLFRHPNFRGANVTIPLKQLVAKFVDHVSETVLSTGASNTVYLTLDGKLKADNTDIDGFLAPLNIIKQSLYGKSALIFGSGGAAQAVVYALKYYGLSSVYIVSRNPDLLGSPDFKAISYSQWVHVAKECELFINTSPVGMYPNVDDSPVKDELTHLLNGKICYDLIYRPLETRFLRQARQNGAKTINGLEMFIGQASHAFKLFTNEEFPTSDVRSLLNEYFVAQKEDTQS